MGLISTLSTLFRAGPGANPVLSHAFDVVAKTVDPEILAVDDYQARLQPAIEYALGFYERTVAAVPGPLVISGANHASDPVLATLFATADEVAQCLGRSLAVRSSIRWFVDQGREEVHAVMGMRLRPAKTGNDGAGFADHTIRSLGSSEVDSRECLREAAFSSLVKSFDARMKDKRREWRLMRTEGKIRQELRSRHGAEKGESAPHHDNRDDIFDQYAATAGQDFTPAKALDALVEWLETPEQQLRIDSDEGHPRVGDNTANGRGQLSMPLLATADRRKWLVCMVCFPLQEALAAIGQESQPHRYILI
jgi:hypothetical protein